MSFPRLVRIVPVLFLLSSIGLGQVAGPIRIASPAGLTASLDPATGTYRVEAAGSAWTWEGTLDEPAAGVETTSGSDRIGPYHELRFAYARTPGRSASIRLYDDSAVALFAATSRDASHAGYTHPFPAFTTCPPGLQHFSYKDITMAPPVFSLAADGAPWLFFDAQDHAAIFSPASDFMVSRLTGDGDHAITSALNEGVVETPANFTHRTLLAVGDGINATWDRWGAALMKLQNRTRPANDADIGLRYLGYWTDHGADYYYAYDQTLGYAGTLEALVERYRKEAIPIRYLQLDSWWYYKTLTDPDGKTGTPKNPELPHEEWNRYGGLLRYRAHPSLLPDGLDGFQKRIGLPFITHNRWVDPASPDRKNYIVSGYAAIDPRWWADTIGYIHAAHTVCYEQDWLITIYQHSPLLSTSITQSDEFTDDMAQAAARDGVSLQYCMPLPRFFLEGTRYANLTTIRTSGDRFKRTRWDYFLYTSRLAASAGIWPWTDVYMSAETDNLLISVLSGGMVGTGDAMGREDRANLLRAARLDGVLVKPDAPIVPTDETYLADARKEKSPMVAWTHSDAGGRRVVYVFSYSRSPKSAEGGFVPAAFGLTGPVCVLNARTNEAKFISAGERFSLPLAQEESAYFIIAPVNAAGLAFFGDADKFVVAGRKRLPEVADVGGATTVSVIFAAGESEVRLFGYARGPVSVTASQGSVQPVRYDPATHRFEVRVAPGGPARPEPTTSEPITGATLQLSPG